MTTHPHSGFAPFFLGSPLFDAPQGVEFIGGTPFVPTVPEGYGSENGSIPRSPRLRGLPSRRDPRPLGRGWAQARD